MSKLKGTVDDAAALFGATALAAPKPKKVAKRGQDREHIDMGTDLDYLAAIGVVTKALDEMQKTLRAEQQRLALAHFSERMVERRTKPDAFIGTGKKCEAYVGVTRKGSNRPLDEETVARLQKMKVPVSEVEAVPERLVINPDILKDQKTLRVLAEAIQNTKELEGVPVILKQEAQSSFVTNDETLPALARAVKNVDQAEEMLPKVAGITIGKFQIGGLDDKTGMIKAALQIISGAKLLGTVKVSA